MNLQLLMALLPVVFMLHDFEEILFFKPWLIKNKALLQRKFPVLTKRILPHFEKLSTGAFTLAVAEEFILLSFCTYISLIIKVYYVWYALFMAFSIHLVVHIIQWLALRSYTPSIITSVLALPYCIYTFFAFIKTTVISTPELILYSVIGVIVMLINLLFAHKLASVYNNWEANIILQNK